jgi:alpha-L-rhamnosidase
MNAVGVKLGNGWYSQEQLGGTNYGKYEKILFDRAIYCFTILGPPRLLFTLNITFVNGDIMQVLSDQKWTGRQGSVLHDSVYNGEAYDARNDRADWARVGFNDSLSAWITPESLPSPISATLNGQLVLQDMPPVRAGLDALHFEVNGYDQHKGYLKTSDVSEIKGASLTDSRGSVLKPIGMWQPVTGTLLLS